MLQVVLGASALLWSAFQPPLGLACSSTSFLCCSCRGGCSTADGVKSRVERDNLLPQPAGRASPDAAQDVICFLSCKGTLLTDVQLPMPYHPQVLYWQGCSQSLFCPACGHAWLSKPWTPRPYPFQYLTLSHLSHTEFMSLLSCVKDLSGSHYWSSMMCIAGKGKKKDRIGVNILAVNWSCWIT